MRTVALFVGIVLLAAAGYELALALGVSHVGPQPGEIGLDELARRLRASDPAVIARAREGWLLLDPRTLDDDEARAAAGAVVDALAEG